MHYGRTQVVICDDEFDLGQRASSAVAQQMRNMLDREQEIRMILAAGERQITFLDALSNERDIEWSRVVCFNMDEFWDPNIPEQYTCGYQIRSQLYNKVRPKSYHAARFNAPEPYVEAQRFENALRSAGPVHILCQGIGTSGHLAFNEPYQTNFRDPAWVRVVDIAEQSKKQLTHDPNFRELPQIPAKGITMTIPAMLSAPYVCTIVPLALKRNIIKRLFETPTPTDALPASILKTVEGTLFLDRHSSPEHLL